MKLKGIYITDFKDRHGNLIEHEESTNYVTDTGITHILGRSLTTGITETADWYVGLLTGTQSSKIKSSDAMSTKTWTESTDYAETTRPNWGQTLSGQYVSNTGAKCTYTINKNGSTFDGAFVCSSKTRGGDSGILVSIAAFASPKVGDSGDKLEVSYKIVGSDDTSS